MGLRLSVPSPRLVVKVEVGAVLAEVLREVMVEGAACPVVAEGALLEAVPLEAVMEAAQAVLEEEEQLPVH